MSLLNRQSLLSTQRSIRSPQLVLLVAAGLRDLLSLFYNYFFVYTYFFLLKFYICIVVWKNRKIIILVSLMMLMNLRLTFDFWIKVSLSCICKTRIIYLACKIYFSLLCLEKYFEIMLAYQYKQIVEFQISYFHFGK